METECIAAIATPPGIGALAIVRMSGTGCHDRFDRIFRGDVHARDVRARSVLVGRVVDPGSGETIDDVVATVYRAPRSYSGEDMVEIGCHGGRYVPAAVLEACLEAGARVAEAGEFTKRAFRNGKMDLIQAEGVAAMIRATTRRAHRVAVDQLHRSLSREVEALREGILQQMARLEYEIDFPEEIQAPPAEGREAFLGGMGRLRERIASLGATWREGAMVTEGALVVIAGRPNVGKSSLFNRMARRERTIVTPHPGTTRDAVEQEVALGGLRVRLVDTAGLRETEDEVERLGVEVSRRYLGDADVVLFVTEAGERPRGQERAFLEGQRGRAVVRVVNKIDRLARGARETAAREGEVAVSAVTGEGFEALRDLIVTLALGREDRAGPAIATLRQHRGLEVALRGVDRAIDGARGGLSAEFLVEDLRGAAGSLAELIGDVTEEEVLDTIFSTFCVGK